LHARHRASAAAAVACLLALHCSATGAAAEEQRALSLYNIHTKETVTAVYKKNGKYVPEEMQKINWVMRDWRKDEATTMDPGLIDLLWEIHTELGSKQPIHIISGYRSRATNDMLRRTVGGQASQSRHILGKAADVHFPDVPIKLLRYSALIREKGGVGYYPTSNIPFVHVDIDRPRAWPRLPRAELALLFPTGRTQHLPQDGGPITPADVRLARVKHADLVTQIGEFHDYRKRPRSPVLTASLMPPLPKLLREPEPAHRPLPKIALAPDAKHPKATQGGHTAAVVAAPQYDEEHPEELSYRPFPIAPLLTATASADDPAFAVLVHPDLSKVLELMEFSDTVPPLRLRPGVYDAKMMWASQSQGVPVDLSALDQAGNAKSKPPEGPLDSRKVASQPQ
jgi:uncharacterized protein YcbK (DUF882 family)